MDPPAESVSSGGRKPRNPRKIDSDVTPLRINRNAGDGLTIGLLSLNKPSGIRSAPNWERDVCFDIADPNDKFSLHILRDIFHENILHLEAIIPDPDPKKATIPDPKNSNESKSEKSSCVKICVERYTDSLYKYASRLSISEPKQLETLQKLLRQVTEGLNELRVNGLYHGNLNIHTTYFDRPSGLVKLANFKEKGEHQELVQAQLEDWHAAGTMADEICTMQKTMDPKMDCFLLDDLANQLKTIQPGSLDRVKDDVLDHVFFWKKNRISSFFIYDIQEFLDLAPFQRRVEALHFIPTNWNNNDHNGLLTAMDNYRQGCKMPGYTAGRFQYIKFVSGAYTHQDQLVPIDVHGTIQEHCPRLLLELVKIVSDLRALSSLMS